MIRYPICSVVGHVDHGKSSILDFIRGSSIISREAGGITQAIGASKVPVKELKRFCGMLWQSLGKEVSIPGLLFIDTPGHAAFSNLRRRGGNLADISILVVDINEGFKPQTVESLQILKEYKTPLVVAANKLDLVPGYRSDSKAFVLKNIESQAEPVKAQIDKKLYELVGSIFEQGFNAERFDRVEDYTKQVSIVPVSAKTGEGIPELITVILALSQKYLEKTLQLNPGKEAKATILEVKDIPGFGTVIDAILYDGVLRVSDSIVFGTLDEPGSSKVKGIFVQPPLSEIRDKKCRFKPAKEVVAAEGIRIYAQSLERALSGMPLVSARSQQELERAVSEVKKDVGQVVFERDHDGLVIKADSLGSLEALQKLLQENNIPVKKAGIGSITKKDLIEAHAMKEKDALKGVILGFNSELKDEPNDEGVEIISEPVIYKIIERYQDWVEEKSRQLEKNKLSKIPSICKLRILPNYVFRESNPAIVGVEVLSGVLKPDTPVMNTEGAPVTRVKQVQLNCENVPEVKKNAQVAVSLPKVTFGRQIKENDILYTLISSVEFKKYREAKKMLSPDQIELLREIASIMKQRDPSFGL
ncbi:MAG TPA: translation initiation factor IF-2 [Candidatus Woesearchaeota archaeon]|nr:translation initiation factor IF-2 [Candidatus Woesearchaeota archaeon]